MEHQAIAHAAKVFGIEDGRLAAGYGWPGAGDQNQACAILGISRSTL